MVKRGFYRHYKGGLYVVLASAKHSETREDLVVYYSLHFFGFHVRPAAMWDDVVDANVKYIDLSNFTPPLYNKDRTAFLTPRFVKISFWRALRILRKKPKI